MSHQVTLIPGDGIGPEVSAAAREAVDSTGVKIDWELAELNAEAHAATKGRARAGAVAALRSAIATELAGGTWPP